MPYNLEIDFNCKKEIEKACFRNKTLSDVLEKKILRILENPQQFKPLRFPLQNRRRVHVLKNFVLTYEIIEETNIVKLRVFGHHDDVYSILRLL
ncbi:MAG: type II toxin-antitoxin system RelE/ParE family toxin [Candidatus Aenigmatarchaeota archaeon]